MNQFNCEITECGLRYIAHGDICELKLCTRDFGLTIPLNKISEFTKLFPDINWEDGYFFHKLKGRYLRAYTDRTGRIVGLKHIVKDITYVARDDDDDDTDTIRSEGCET